MTDKQPEALRLADRIDLKDYYEFDASLHCQKAAAELRRLHIVEKEFQQWITKTEWVQKSSQSHDLGIHRADVMKQRLDRLRDENEALRAALEQPQVEQKPVAKVVLTEQLGLPCLQWLDLDRQFDFKGGEFLYTHPQPKRELMDNEARRIYNEATYHASIAVFMTRMDSEQPDADEKGVSGWLQEAEDRVKHRII